MTKGADTRNPYIQPTSFEAAAPAILAAMDRGVHLSRAAPIAGVSAQTACTWVADGDRDPTGKYGPFAREVRAIQAKHIGEAEEMHREIRMRGDSPRSIEWYLERVARKEYGVQRDTAPAQDAPELPDASPDDVAEALGKR